MELSTDSFLANARDTRPARAATVQGQSVSATPPDFNCAMDGRDRVAVFGQQVDLRHRLSAHHDDAGWFWFG